MSRPRILVVEDSPDILELLCLHLQAAGFDTDDASDGEAALEMARRRPPHAVVTDLTMPRMDGADLVVALRAEPDGAGLPIIVLTAAAEEDPRVLRLRGLERVEIIFKPPRWGEISATVRRLLGTSV